MLIIHSSISCVLAESLAHFIMKAIDLNMAYFSMHVHVLSMPTVVPTTNGAQKNC